MKAERREDLQARPTPRAIRLAERTARVKGVEFSERAEKRRLRGESPAELRAEIRDNRREPREGEQGGQGHRPRHRRREHRGAPP